MGLIYSSSDSSAMMRALSSNLAVARTTTSELTAGCQQLIAAIDGHTLSGAAYNAGKGLFSELVIPTIHRMTAAVDNVQSDLAKYSAADAFIASEGFLDEDKLKLKIKIMKANQQLLHDSARAVATLAHSQPIPGIYELLQNAQRTFIKMAESMQQDIDKLHKQIQKLNEFDRQTKNLFATSLEEMQLAMQGILVLNETTVKSNGLYTLPSGVDKSYFTEIKKDTKNEVTDKQLLAGCTILYVHDKKNGFNYYMLEKDGYSYRIDEEKLSGDLASLVKKYDLDVVELTPKELTTRANNQQKKGYNYFEKDDRVRGLGLLSKGQGVMDEIQESGLWDSLWTLGMGVASVRNAQTFSNGVKGTDNAALRGSKNGKTYVLDKPKSTGNVTYKKASVPETTSKDLSQFEKLKGEYASKEIPNADRIGSGLKDDSSHRAASFITEEQLAKGRVTSFTGSDNKSYSILQINEDFNGLDGIYEYILDSTGKITHQRFIEGGKITGFPNQKVPKGGY
ncbi:T7SS effector LXG polymorphic toxin [Enterococcus faecalis]|uniref:T7SS effector LXG polymorphic toxin n=1 Tax=Enterococcus TaxID=1350 RepID=UPI0019258682|nr:T7SS effector LXG polymorphic toxin [Enterococcus faecalis]EGO8079895.1 hypothetical protein [Enterococcus faecalis]EJI7156106.1 hypothetical protein [Enterococcus faecalis]ELU9008816.1 hypothetical protein [Enterococcus faecalis]MDK0525135.1 T7SS effector LXG polymorphic toxin [Enterococcus faecalis]WHK57568.1 T7SS effector LXG polymorphic toxin [Enterococcus faecalis]